MKYQFISLHVTIGYPVHLGMDRGVFFLTQCVQNETRDEFWKSREIKNASIPNCMHITFFLIYARKLRIFKDLKRAERAS